MDPLFHTHDEGITSQNNGLLPSSSSDKPAPKKAKTVKLIEKRPHVWRRRKCSSIKIMHGFTRHRWPNSTNSTTNCFPIQHIRQNYFCNYFLFPNLKKWFGKKRFTTREQLIAETEAYFEELDISYYSDGLKKLENHWIKYIELKGDYVEK